MVDSVRILGLEDAVQALRELPKKLRFGAIRKGLRAAGNVFKGEAKAQAPVLQAPAKHRIAGTVRKNIVIRSSKLARRRGDIGVYVTVKTLSKKQIIAGKSFGVGKNPNDPFYFRFLEKGTKKMSARPFISTAFDSKGSAAIEAFTGEINKQIAIENTRR
jgi:HK97 gp10 family phage protein